MFFKTINDLMSSNGQISILLVFDIYFKITKLDVLSLSIKQRIIIMQKVIDEV